VYRIILQGLGTEVYQWSPGAESRVWVCGTNSPESNALFQTLNFCIDILVLPAPVTLSIQKI